MKITIEPTEALTTMDGIPVRLWEGVTDQGVKCKVFVHRVAVHKDEDSSAFEREMAEQVPPGRFVDLRQII